MVLSDGQYCDEYLQDDSKVIAAEHSLEENFTEDTDAAG